MRSVVKLLQRRHGRVGLGVAAALALLVTVPLIAVAVTPDDSRRQPQAVGESGGHEASHEGSPGNAAASSPGADPSPTPAAPPTTGGTERAADGAHLTTAVTRIVDGDTLYVADLDERIRLIGIDTPETRHPNKGVECYGHEATAHLAGLVPPGTEVRVQWDVERSDRYDRPLGYLYRVADDLFVNLAMVADGYASASTVPPNVAHADELIAAQRRALEAGRGLWSVCDGDIHDDLSDGGDGAATGGGAGSSSGVRIATIRYDAPGGDVEHGDSEYVELANGGSAAVDVGGWSVTDDQGHRITLPPGSSIPADGSLRIHTGPGESTAEAYFAGESQAIWNNSGGDTATLRDGSGNVVDTLTYSS